jgi:hypothetical protein
MIRSILFYTIALLFVSNIGISQTSEMMLNERPFDAERYSDFTGTAYLWESPVSVKLSSVNQQPIEGIMGNYNMAEGEFEVYKDKNFIVLNKLEFPKIEYVNLEGQITTLISVSHPKLSFGYCVLHHQEENFMILERRKKLKSTRKVETPGQTQHMNKLKNSRDYYILKNGKLIKIKLSRNKITKEFGHKKEIKEYIKLNDLKVKKIKDAVILLKYMNEKGWIG